jgi:hypothetical protein
MHRLRRFRRLPKSTVVLIALATAALIVAHFVAGSQPKLVHVDRLHRVPVDRTGWNDYLRTGLWIAAALLAGGAGLRRHAAAEPLADGSALDPRAVRTGVLGAQAQVDQAVGTSPTHYSGGG